jgi:hypothetical protein
MSNKDQGMVSLLDRIATRLTGRQVHMGFTGPHMIIAANAILLLIALAGMLATTRDQDFGQDLVVWAMIASALHKAAVELKERGSRELDEREKTIRWKSIAIGGWAVTTLISIWAILISHFADNGLWYPSKDDDWLTLGAFILGLMGQTSSIASAWMTPSYAAELLDES